MHRCVIDAAAPPAVGDAVALSPQESGHMIKSLRMKTGDPVQLIAAERLFLAAIESVEDGIVQVRIVDALPSPEPGVKITLMQGLPKADKLEWIIQKATELGVFSILPVEMSRSVARIGEKEEKKRERYQRIALEAAKQAGRAHIPDVLPALRFQDAIKTMQGKVVYVAWEDENSLRLSQAIAQDQPGEITIVIGPEGGIATDEIEQLLATGAQTVTLGRRILRTETAGLCALAAALTALGEM
ncbi:MAG TPA: RsmE family RNA methyltransferase [Candidatus Limiplasma sp.]|nr:RsmE family RNA methyltransferase [Candidatus Limiplasma sp.]HRX09506.1 RsmE family RNA methyltransferase [Candidatus Limiplasma sp.]